MKRFLPVVFLILIANSISAQNVSKKPLDHSVYKSWENVTKSTISNNGAFVSWEVNPQKGDGNLFLYHISTDRTLVFPRGKVAEFAYANDFFAFSIKPQTDTLRQMKFDKVKKEKLPKDSLGIFLFGKDSLIKIADVKSFKIAEEGPSRIAYLLEKQIPEEVKSIKADSLVSKEEKDSLKKVNKKLKKQLNTHLHILNPISGEEVVFENVSEYSISKNGELFVIKSVIKDSLDSTSIWVFNPLTLERKELFRTTGEMKNFGIDEVGTQIAFVVSEDTGKHKLYDLYYGLVWKKKKPKLIIDNTSENMLEGWSVSEYSSISFSKAGNRIFFGNAPILEPEPEDTLLDEEKYKLDIWNWQDTRLQTQQNKSLSADLKKNYKAVYLIDEKKMRQLATEEMPRVRFYNRGNGRYALGFAQEKYQKAYSWSGSRFFDAFLIDLKTGEKSMILEKEESSVSVSPAGKYVYWYAAKDSSWYIKTTKGKEVRKISGAIPFPLYQEEHDVPSNPRPYGVAAWTADDEFVLIYDRYDLWKIDPANPQNTVNLTNSYGRKNEIRLKYVRLNPEEEFLSPNQDLVLSAFGEENKKSGYFRLRGVEKSDPTALLFDDYSIKYLKKSKDGEVYSYYKSSFTDCPDLYVSYDDFKTSNKLSDANPQQKEYLWGSVEEISWTMENGKENKGLLYKPENFDPSKKYPMIVYYYERYTDGLHQYYVPKPSHSVISFPLFTSNGYLIFIPDIYYDKGHPGKSALNTVVSGTNYLIEQGFVDQERLGLQGQSWGGYQTAYIITQTDMFKCAMGGAVVSNMTSAFGGIRWESGMSRMFQYEAGQSRIGATLWENLDLYIENSPLFFADQVKTPLLLMHNDKDGAVPWYQGIEFFMALRRLEKPVWMLTYNGEAHNLKQWPNRMDLSIRMSQFFDHYLLDKPAPVWMTDGIPALKKGKESGYELIKKGK